MSNKFNIAYVFLFLTVTFWAGNFIVGKFASFYDVPPFSLNFTQVISGVLMISTIPVMIMLFSSILKIEKTNIFQIIGVIFSFAGVIMIITKANLEILKNLDFNKGDITMVIAMFSWALYSTLLKGKQYELTQISLLPVSYTHLTLPTILLV